MSFAYNVSTLLRVIRQHERSTSAFTYTDHSFTELSHLGHIINLSMIKRMIEEHHETYQSVLRQKAFFGEDIPEVLQIAIVIEKIVDSVENKSAGYTFIEDPRNGFQAHKEKYGAWLLSDETRRQEYLYYNGSTFVWKPKKAIELLQSFQEIELELAPGLVFSSGPSCRNTEFGRHLYREMPGCSRNLGMVMHNVSLTSTTDKTSHQRLIDLFVPHIPTRKWATSLLWYLIIIRPFAEYLVEQLFDADSEIVRRYRFYLWPGVKSTMTDDALRGKLGQVTEKYLGQSYGIKLWRTLTTVVLSCSDEEVIEINQQHYRDTANMHTTTTANAVYGGNTVLKLGNDPRVIAGCVKVGLSWQRRIGIEESDMQTRIDQVAARQPQTNLDGVALGLSSSNVAFVAETKALREETIATVRAGISETMAEIAQIYFPPAPRPQTSLHLISDIEVHPSRLIQLRKFMNDPKAQWSCPEQAVFVEELISGKANVLGILGTGFGKTTAIMFLAKVFSAGKSTLVIMPLASLHEDFHKRARDYGLSAERWKRNGKFNASASIITAAVEDLEEEKFTQ